MSLKSEIASHRSGSAAADALLAMTNGGLAVIARSEATWQS